MPRALAASDAELVTRACLGAICGPDGPTDEQLMILRALATHLWGLDDPDLSPSAAITSGGAAEGITDERLRRRTRELMVLLELSRHPLEESHAERIEEYCHALGGDGPGMAIARDYVSQGAEAAVADWMRRFEEKAPEMMEPEMLELAQADADDAAVRFAEIETAIRSAAPGTLGAEFAAFYDRNNFTIGPESIPLLGHDMAHVIGGYDATPVGEIALGAMKLMITDSDIHWLEFLGSVIIHETGILFPGYEPGDPPLQDPANVEMVMLAMERGRATRTDFSYGEHLSMIDWPYADVLDHYGVPPLPTAS
ncbi:MAG: hypothetical protein ACKOIA_05365 [Acidimicrobiia bacterium]